MLRPLTQQLEPSGETRFPGCPSAGATTMRGVTAARPLNQFEPEDARALVETGGAPPAPAATLARGELVSPLEPLVAAFVATLADAPQTQRTYARACARFLVWLGPEAGPQALTLATMAAYQAHLADPDADGRRRSSATVRKDRAALNSLLRWAGEHGVLERRQAELARSVRLPKARAQGREAPKALSDELYERLVAVVAAQLDRDRLMGSRDLAIVRVLGDAGLRCEERVRAAPARRVRATDPAVRAARRGSGRRVRSGGRRVRCRRRGECRRRRRRRRRTSSPRR